MILILTCINSNHQTFILFLAFFTFSWISEPRQNIQCETHILKKKWTLPWLLSKFFRLDASGDQSRSRASGKKGRIRTIFGRSRACNQADREAVQGRIWQKDLFVSRSGVGKKWNDASPPLSLHQGEAARKLRPPRPWPPMHLAALCTVPCADRPLQYRLWLPINTYLPSVQYLTSSSVQYLTSSSVKYLICPSVLYLICPRVQYLARTRGAWGAAQVQRTKRLYPIRGDEDGWYRDDGGW